MKKLETKQMVSTNGGGACDDFRVRVALAIAFSGWGGLVCAFY